jgi:TRAP-type C4-dicarboxylate transport system permease small subunit
MMPRDVPCISLGVYLIACNRGSPSEEHAMKKKKESMNGYLRAVLGISRVLNVVAGSCLTFIVLLTIADVILRRFRMPILGTYEIVGFAGAAVVGFAIPLTSWYRGQIFVDFFVNYFSKRVQNIFNLATRVLVICLFILFAWNLYKYGAGLEVSGEVSPTLNFPFYPVAYGIAVCCVAECFVLASDIIKIFGGNYE